MELPPRHGRRRAAGLGEPDPGPSPRRAGRDRRGARHRRGLSELAAVPGLSGLRPHPVRLAARSHRQQRLPARSRGARHVRRWDDRGIDEQRDRCDRARVRRIDHAGARARQVRHRRRRDDRSRHPLRGRAPRPGDQPQPRVHAGRDRGRHSRPADRDLRFATNHNVTSSLPRATRASPRSPIRRARRR